MKSYLDFLREVENSKDIDELVFDKERDKNKLKLLYLVNVNTINQPDNIYVSANKISSEINMPDGIHDIVCKSSKNGLLHAPAVLIGYMEFKRKTNG
ncbi:hypothetical protein GWK48_10375 [Metallosphaera tengchongensis]|uniref:Uncharacterized protein n=1 Tax=Metallosphaera tengchongensis TaxID=1532350 RepID=A0A6N0NZF1_9CREN|nr:hypothetical protein [Metallosphaera tengchongensis]QKR00738.1 hypothetical protein GWK48_10375 [Metallosphaera tengchongensis]